MPSTSEALVTPAVLRWARERARFTPELAAQKLKTKSETIEKWERGEKRPTFRQAQEIAKKLRVPFGYLFLEGPPTEPLPLADFRTIRDVEFNQPTHEFINLLYDVVAKQEWLHDFLESEEAEELPFVGRFRIDAPFAEVAADISSTLGINRDLRDAAASWEAFLRSLIERAEQSRIMVMRSGLVAGQQRRRVSEKEFRGFAVSDKLAPLIYINGSDAKAAQIFTLAHELAHIWTGQSGISNTRPEDFFRAGTVEATCNSIATEVLVPEADFSRIWNSRQTLDANLQSATRHFRVSTLVILRRALELGALTPEAMWPRYRQEENRFYERQAEGGGDFYKNLFSRNGRLLTNIVVDAVRTDKVLFTEAASLLNVRPPIVRKLLDKSLGSAHE